MRAQQVAIALSVVAAAVLACSNPASPRLAACAGPLTVSATAQVQPTFSWAPDCAVDHIFVIDSNVAPSAGGPGVPWGIAANVPGQGTGSPLLYGTTPAGMKVVVAPTALVAGRVYVFAVYSTQAELASVRFTP